MYEPFYGFREAPFKLTSNPRFLFLTEQHREGLSTLVYGLSSAKPITVLIGEAGTGKSTLIRAALESELCRNVTCAVIENPTLTRDEFIEALSARFELGAAASASKAILLNRLESMIHRRRRSRNEITALVVDEAHALPDEILEEIRFLTNLETDEQKLLPVVLVGQPMLADRLNDPGMRQLKQRIALRSALTSLDLQDTAAYIASRIRTAGGNPAGCFTQQAVTLIHEHSLGLPRTISVICDNALLAGFAMDRRPVDASTVLEVCRDFDLGAETRFPPEGHPLALVRPEQTEYRSNGSAGVAGSSTNSHRSAVEPLGASIFGLRRQPNIEASKGPYRQSSDVSDAQLEADPTRG